MATFKRLFVTDKSLETGGVWHDLGAGVRIKVARMGTVEYNATLRRLAQPHKSLARRVMEDSDNLDETDLVIFKEIEARAMAKHVLVGWEGFTESDIPDSPEVPYSEDKAFSFIQESDDFRKLLVELAAKASNFKEATKGN